MSPSLSLSWERLHCASLWAGRGHIHTRIKCISRVSRKSRAGRHICMYVYVRRWRADSPGHWYHFERERPADAEPGATRGEPESDLLLQQTKDNGDWLIRYFCHMFHKYIYMYIHRQILVNPSDATSRGAPLRATRFNSLLVFLLTARNAPLHSVF